MAAKDLQKDIFLTCRSIFAGQNALIRKRKAVRDVLSQHKSKLVHLVSRHGWDKVTDVAKGLLERRIFESNLQAKGAFPELFETSPSRGAQRAASEIEAAHSEAEALAEAEPIDADWNSRRDTDGGLPINEIQERKECSATGEATVKRPPPPPQQSAPPAPPASSSFNNRSPTLFPAYLPFASQHRMLVATQSFLEQACFDFAETWLPDYLRSKNWSCHEAVELNQWTKVLSKQRRNIPAKAFITNHGPPVDSVLFANDRLRHAAVHRLPTTGASVQQMMASAARLAIGLNDYVRSARINELQSEVDTLVKNLEINKEFLESRLDKKLKTIDEERAALDRREQAAIATMKRDDEQYQQSIGPTLDQKVREVFGNIQRKSSMSVEDVTMPGSNYATPTGEAETIHDPEQLDGVPKRTSEPETAHRHREATLVREPETKHQDKLAAAMSELDLDNPNRVPATEPEPEYEQAHEAASSAPDVEREYHDDVAASMTSPQDEHATVAHNLVSESENTLENELFPLRPHEFAYY